MQEIFKNQKNVFIVFFGCGFLILISWYSFFYKNLASEYEDITNSKNQLNRDIAKYKRMQSQVNALENDWNNLNTDFKNTIQKIPNKNLYENVADYLYSLVINHGLKIEKFSPSNSPIDKKTILMPDSGDEILVEKIPVDIILQGSFINFGQFLESMLTSQYRLTVSDVGVNQSSNSYSQQIRLISYIYIQSITNKKNKDEYSVANTSNNLDAQSTTKSTVSNLEVAEAVKSIKPKIKISDSLEGVPEMWLEPATEPIDNATEMITSNSKKKKVSSNKIIEPRNEKKLISQEKESEEPAITIEKNKSSSASRPNKFQDYYNITVLESKTCEKVKNNLPINPKNRFTYDAGKVYCHSLLNNNSEKHIDIYHIWYMNGNLKAKVRIRVRAGKEIPAISHRIIENSDIGMWKIEITDNDKKILDTVIFEVV